MRRLFVFSCVVLLGSYGSSVAGPISRRLPSADEFHLTLREAVQSSIALGPSCSGEAELTLPCRAFTLDLENASAHTVRISGLECFEPDITFLGKAPNSSAWSPISQPGRPTCNEWNWTNIRLIPGEHTHYTTRLISPRREVHAVPASDYTLQATWALFGCTEDPEGTDCLAPLQVVREGSSAADVAFYGPVIVASDEVTVHPTAIPEIGTPKLSFHVEAVPGDVLAVNARGAAGCTPESRSIECSVFHYSIRNIGDRAVRLATASCFGLVIVPEYFAEQGWKRVPPSPAGWMCGANSLVETPILVAESLEGNFTLPALFPPLDTSSLQMPGEYRFRFTFEPVACFASPDGRFCLRHHQSQPKIVSNDVTVRSEAAMGTSGRGARP